MGSGAIAGGSGGEYFVGAFDGTKFVPDVPGSQWVDYGRDFYAPISWSDIPASDGRRLWIGWMNNWETCLNPTSPWRSAMSIPRELTLRRVNGAIRLCQAPVRELETLRQDGRPIEAQAIGETPVPLNIQGQQQEFVLEFEPGDAAEFGIRVLKKGDQQTVIGYDVKSRALYVDRTKSGNVSFHRAFPGRHPGPLTPDAKGRIRMRVLVDSCSVEVFGNDGETVITDLVFPDEDAVQAELFARGGKCRITQGKVYKLNSVWPRPTDKTAGK